MQNEVPGELARIRNLIAFKVGLGGSWKVVSVRVSKHSTIRR